jgi:ABC-type Na+ transport system ATPase subunit NatA
MPIIEVQDVRKRYGDTKALRGVSLTVEEGEIFGILGPNGAGKTTLVECISALRRPDEGRLSVAGLNPLRDRDRLRQLVGVQLQESALPDKLRVIQAIELYASFYPDPADGERLLETLGLGAKRGTRYGQLSGGQKQRLSVALALIGQPRIAVLDELTTGLDPQARREVWSLIEDIRAGGVTVVLGGFFVGLMVLAAVLVLNDPVYGFYSWTGYLWIFRVLDGHWRVPALLAVATITGTSQHGGAPSRSVDAGEPGLHEQLLAGAREAGVLDERQRMAREIHDTLAQGLVGIITQLEAAARGGRDSERRSGVALELARESLAEARRSVQALAPAELDQVRLPDALANVTTKWSALSGVTATTTGTPVSLRPEIEVALLRTAQEALANVAKHAHADTVALTLSYMDDVVMRAVRAAARGQSVLSPTVASRLMTQIRTPAEGGLSDRELEVLTLATVKTHLLHIYAKLSVSDRAAAVAEGFNRGLLTPREAGR